MFFFLSGCVPGSAPTPFIAPFTHQITPTPANVLPAPAPTSGVAQLPLPVETAESTLTPQTIPTSELSLPTATVEPAGSTPEACSDSLMYIEDLNFPDGSVVSPGQLIEKQWRVKNNGTCAWSADYQLKLVQGYPPLGAEGEQALFPVPVDTEATISINFTAPLESGSYQTAWQAYNPGGQPFGDEIYMVIVVP